MEVSSEAPKPRKPSRKPSRMPRDAVPGFAAMIWKARETLGWSRADLSARSRVSQTCIYNIEKLDRSPTLKVAARLAAALGLRVWLHNPTVIIADYGKLAIEQNELAGKMKF